MSGCGPGSGDDPRPPHPLDLALTWRRFQEVALAQLLSAAMRGDQRLQLVAPPGSGKTLMGLYVAFQLGRPVVVLCNTRAIVAQWRAAFLRFGISERPDFDDLTDLVATDLPRADERMPLLTVTTYQAFTRQRPAKLARGEDVSERLAPTVLAQHDRYGRSGPLLVLDECHHLRAWWGDVLADFVARWPDSAVLGLTATPPVDAPADERRRFEKLVTDVTHEIPLVGAVREGLLVPFRDLAVFVRPGEEEAQALAGCEAGLQAWLEEAREGVGDATQRPGHADAWVPGLLHHVRERCVRPGRRTLTCTDFLELIDRDADFAIALVRYLHACGESWPAEVYPMPEMAFPLTRADVLAVVDDYLVAVLVDAASRHAKARVESLRAALKPLNVRVRTDGLRGQGDGVEDVFGRARARFVAASRILRREWALLGTDVCAAVICDFERTALGGQRVEDTAGFVPGAIGAFRAVAADPELQELLPMLATGSERWLPAALVPALSERLGALSVGLVQSPLDPATVGTTRQTFVQVRLPGHEGKLLGAMTGLLERDHSHCVVGTRALLGEGWDCTTLNTLVDLTSSRSHVAVNQLRGRVLRQDPERPEKVAHIWDVVAVPNLAGGAGAANVSFAMADLERFAQKHARFYAPAEDATLERGAGHVHPALRGAPQRWLPHIDAVGADLWRSAEQRAAVSRAALRKRWRLGEPLQERERCEVAVEMPPATDSAEQPDAGGAARVAALATTPLVGEASDAWRLAWTLNEARRDARTRWWGTSTALVGCGVALGALASPVAGVAVGVVGLAVAAVHASRLRAAATALQRIRTDLSEAERTRRVLRVLLRALAKASKKTQDVDVGLDVRDDGDICVQLAGSDARARERVASAVDQALRGCPAPHYAVEVFSPRTPVLGLLSPTPDVGPATAEAIADTVADAAADATAVPPGFVAVGWVPVPAALGISRRVAEAWAEAWRSELGPCRLVAVRKSRATDALPWRDPATLRWLRATQRRGDARLVLE